MIESVLTGLVPLTAWLSMTATPPSPPPPPPPAVAHAAPWDALARCESGNDPTTNTGNGYYGALQWNIDTWWWLAHNVLGADAPHPVDASLTEEVAVAERYVALEQAAGRGGFNPWPGCADAIGLPR